MEEKRNLSVSREFIPKHDGGDNIHRIKQELGDLLRQGNHSIFLVCGRPEYVRIIQEEAGRLGCMENGEYIFIDIFNGRNGKWQKYPWKEYKEVKGQEVSWVPMMME